MRALERLLELRISPSVHPLPAMGRRCWAQIPYCLPIRGKHLLRRLPLVTDHDISNQQSSPFNSLSLGIPSKFSEDSSQTAVETSSSADYESLSSRRNPPGSSSDLSGELSSIGLPSVTGNLASSVDNSTAYSATDTTLFLFPSQSLTETSTSMPCTASEMDTGQSLVIPLDGSSTSVTQPSVEISSTGPSHVSIFTGASAFTGTSKSIGISKFIGDSTSTEASMSYSIETSSMSLRSPSQLLVISGPSLSSDLASGTQASAPPANATQALPDISSSESGIGSISRQTSSLYVDNSLLGLPQSAIGTTALSSSLGRQDQPSISRITTGSGIEASHSKSLDSDSTSSPRPASLSLTSISDLFHGESTVNFGSASAEPTTPYISGSQLSTVHRDGTSSVIPKPAADTLTTDDGNGSESQPTDNNGHVSPTKIETNAAHISQTSLGITPVPSATAVAASNRFESLSSGSALPPATASTSTRASGLVVGTQRTSLPFVATTSTKQNRSSYTNLPKSIGSSLMTQSGTSLSFEGQDSGNGSRSSLGFPATHDASRTGIISHLQGVTTPAAGSTDTSQHTGCHPHYKQQSRQHRDGEVGYQH